VDGDDLRQTRNIKRLGIVLVKITGNWILPMLESQRTMTPPKNNSNC
jgi:hypothetical protein